MNPNRNKKTVDLTKCMDIIKRQLGDRGRECVSGAAIRTILIFIAMGAEELKFVSVGRSLRIS